MPIITLSDGNKYQYNHTVCPVDILQKIKPKFSQNYIAASIDGKLIDIFDKITKNTTLKFITSEDKIGLHIIKHSCAHLLGRAIKKLWPETKMVSGSVINTEFYYDISLDYCLTQDDLVALEQQMLLFVNKNYYITKKYITWGEARDLFLSRLEKYKVYILDTKINYTKPIQLYYHEEYIDMCLGPHVPNIKFCRYFKLCKILKFCKNIKQTQINLQRIYGNAWTNKKECIINTTKKSKYIEKNDHRYLAKQLNLYHVQEEAPGMIFWHEYGWNIFKELKKFIRKQLKIYKYQEVKSPLMMNSELWKKTGHWDNYYTHMFTTSAENREYCIKPMNCPGHIQIFNQGIKSYKDLPIRIAEFGNCHRNEPSGSLHGLMRIREFTQDDAHIFCTNEQIHNELNHCIQMMFDTYRTFGFKNILVQLSTRPNKRIGTEETWDIAEKYLSIVLQKNNIHFQYQPHDGAFYGPKIEFILLDSFNRTWQCGTIQLDFTLPNLLNAYYINNKNRRTHPVMIHRAILGSLERFIGILTEEYSGFFPTWMAPIQVVLINITERESLYVTNIAKKLTNKKIRIKVDLRNETINLKIRLYTTQRIPYILIFGEKEVNQGTVSIRTYRGKKLDDYNLDNFLKKIEYEISNYSLQQLEE